MLVPKRLSVKCVTGISAITIALLLAASLAPASFAAKVDKNHEDAFVAGPADEGRIAQEVRHQLLLQPYYGVFDDLAFRVDGDTVTLLGATANPVLKSDAEKSVKRIEGVGKVINNIELLPVSQMDDQIRLAEYRAIYGDPNIGTRYGVRAIPPIHIIVKNGHVTLEGVVLNQMDKQIITARANAVPNVFSVTNNLQVENS
jgi:osmotically-inducible protein OsmY